MNDGDQVVTREILRQELARYPTREELKEELARFVTRDEFGLFVQTVAQQHDRVLGEFGRLQHLIVTSHETLLREIAQAARVAAEEHRRELGVLDDRYRDLPDRVATLERDLDAHCNDAALHSPRRPSRPRRRPPR